MDEPEQALLWQGSDASHDPHSPRGVPVANSAKTTLKTIFDM
jgi:hypothetical protein